MYQNDFGITIRADREAILINRIFKERLMRLARSYLRVLLCKISKITDDYGKYSLFVEELTMQIDKKYALIVMEITWRERERFKKEKLELKNKNTLLRSKIQKRRIA